MTEEEFHKQLDIGLVPPNYDQLALGLKIVFMVTRAGWSIDQALKILDADPKVANKEALQNLHEMVAELRKEVEELFWRTHLSAWKED